MQLLQQDRVNLLKLLKYVEKLLIILADKLVAAEACPPVDDEVVLLSIKHVVFILICFLDLVAISDYKGHETEWET